MWRMRADTGFERGKNEVPALLKRKHSKGRSLKVLWGRGAKLKKGTPNNIGQILKPHESLDKPSSPSQATSPSIPSKPDTARRTAVGEGSSPFKVFGPMENASGQCGDQTMEELERKV